MAFLELLMIGLALSMDAFAVTIANVSSNSGGTAAAPIGHRRRLLAMPVVFGLFQGLMPLVGYFAGSFAVNLIDSYAGIIALAILAFIGGKMIWDGVRSLRAGSQDRAGDQTRVGEPDGRDGAGITLPALLAQGVATSIDALIVGVSFLALGTNIWIASALIMATTFACCLVALTVGRRFGVLLGDNAQIVGGAVLVLIGIKACFF